jgi:hypothetical protein
MLQLQIAVRKIFRFLLLDIAAGYGPRIAGPSPFRRLCQSINIESYCYISAPAKILIIILYGYHIRTSHPAENHSDLDLIFVGLGIGL